MPGLRAGRRRSPRTEGRRREIEEENFKLEYIEERDNKEEREETLNEGGRNILGNLFSILKLITHTGFFKYTI